MKIYILAIAPALLLGACQGPEAQAGAERDKAAAVAAGQSYDGDGPNERIGAARDRAADAAEDAVRPKPTRYKRSATASARRPISKPNAWSSRRRPCARRRTSEPTRSRAAPADRRWADAPPASVRPAGHSPALCPAVKIRDHSALGLGLEKHHDRRFRFMVDKPHRRVALTVAFGIATFDLVRPDFNRPHLFLPSNGQTQRMVRKCGCSKMVARACPTLRAASQRVRELAQREGR